MLIEKTLVGRVSRGRPTVAEKGAAKIAIGNFCSAVPLIKNLTGHKNLELLSHKSFIAYFLMHLLPFEQSMS